MRWALVALVVVAGCSSRSGASDPATVRHDAALLRAAMANDPATRALEEVDGFVIDRRPVLAAQTIDSGVLPAVRRQLQAVGDVPVVTPEGQRAQEQAVRAYRHRLRSLEAWSHVLARGEVEDPALVDAMHDQRMAEQELVTAIDAVEVLAGGHAGRALPHVPQLHEGEGQTAPAPE